MNDFNDHLRSHIKHHGELGDLESMEIDQLFAKIVNQR